MKTRLILLLLICSNCIVFAQQLEFGSFTSIGEINLYGDWKGDVIIDEGGRSLPVFPIMATIENDCITVAFDDFVSDVVITISKEGRTVYSLNCISDAPKGCTIPVNDFSPGIYLLEFTNPDGGVVYGWFEVR